MAFVGLEGLSKAFQGVEVLDSIDLDIERGDFTVLLGPSGCGKSTTLRLIAGLDSVSRGRITIDGRDVTALEPRLRDIAMVFQNYALYPTMTVEQNMGFGLKAQKLPTETIQSKVGEAAELLGLTDFLDRRPGALSGGQQQRVAIGRAIVREPKLFLFDEPLSNLDAKLRAGMREEIKHLHQRLDATTIYVTHDQEEAMTMADRIVIMNGGQIEQIGTPEDIYFRPATRMVASFIGSPEMNIFAGTMTDNGIDTGLGILTKGPGAVGTKLQVGIRPDDLQLVTEDKKLPEGPTIDCRIGLVELLGPRAILHLRAPDETELTAVVSYEDLKAASGETARFLIPSSALHIFDDATGERL